MKKNNLKNIKKHKPSRELLDFLSKKFTNIEDHSLKFITLSFENIKYEERKWGQEFAISRFNNFLDRKFLRKHVRNAWRYDKRNSYKPYYDKRVKDFIVGGWRKIEPEYVLNNLGFINIHIHAICESSYIPQVLLSKIWLDVISKPFKNKSIKKAGYVYVQDIGKTTYDVSTLIDYIAKEKTLLNKGVYKKSRLYSTF